MSLAVLLAAVLGGMTLLMLISWATQRAVRNAGWTDVFWTLGTGAAGVVCALWPADGALAARQALVAGLVCFWSLRLGLYVAFRVAGSAEDARYADMRKDRAAGFQRAMLWLSLPQGMATAVLCATIAVAARRPEPQLDGRDAAAVAILLIAIGGEALADAQMKRFKADPGNKGKIADAGLWGWSRHPNYFFEWFGWLAYPVMALTMRPESWLTLLAPLAMYLVLTRLTGVPPLERAMLRSRGEAYRRYQARVAPFFPRPPKQQES